MHRAQLPLSMVELALGVVLILSVTLGFGLGAPAADTRQPQLEAYAEDTAAILQTESPRHDGATRLRELVVSEQSFDREKESLDRRIERILPANVMYCVTLPHGTVGFPKPGGVLTGTATVPTGYGRVQIEVWFA